MSFQHEPVYLGYYWLLGLNERFWTRRTAARNTSSNKVGDPYFQHLVVVGLLMASARSLARKKNLLKPSAMTTFGVHTTDALTKPSPHRNGQIRRRLYKPSTPQPLQTDLETNILWRHKSLANCFKWDRTRVCGRSIAKLHRNLD